MLAIVQRDIGRALDDVLDVEIGRAVELGTGLDHRARRRLLQAAGAQLTLDQHRRCQDRAVLLGLVWASTFFVQVPLHGKLERGHDATLVRRLVMTNWLRTFLWTARGVLAVL
ncbi:MAG: hypothetical protein AAF908_01395, partial [Pseudomonadota bacterium]